MVGWDNCQFEAQFKLRAMLVLRWDLHIGLAAGVECIVPVAVVCDHTGCLWYVL